MRDVRNTNEDNKLFDTERSLVVDTFRAIEMVDYAELARWS